MHSQTMRIHDTITKMLHIDTTLHERLQTIFPEQGVIVMSTALGVCISTIVLAIIGYFSAGTTPPPPPGPGAMELVKARLHALGNIMAELAQRVGGALPIIIGGIISWLLNFLSKTAVWLAGNL